MERQSIDDVGVIAGDIEAPPDERIVLDRLDASDRDRLIRVIVNHIADDKIAGMADIPAITPDRLLAKQQERTVDPIPVECGNVV